MSTEKVKEKILDHIKEVFHYKTFEEWTKLVLLEPAEDFLIRMSKLEENKIIETVDNIMIDFDQKNRRHRLLRKII